MDLKKLPFLPLHYFYVLFEKFQKGLFLFLFACVLGAGLWTLGGALWPDYFSLEVLEVAQTDVEKVSLHEVKHNYRSFDFSVNAFRQWVSFSASPILPYAKGVYFFILLQIIAWSVMLAAATEIKSRWSYLFYFLYSLFLFSSDLFSYLISDEALLSSLGGSQILARSIKFLLVLPPLTLAFCFQLNIIRWRLPIRLLIFTLWNFLLFSFPFSQGGWETLHQISVQNYSFNFILVLLFLYFIGKEPSKILFAAATNRPQKSARVDYRLILGFCLILLVVEVFWLIEYLNFGILTDFKLGFRPIYLLVFSAVLMVFTSQNHFHQVRGIFSMQHTYTFILLSWALIVLSFMGYQYSLGDPLLKFTIERAAVVFFLSMGLLHILFVITNHLPLLKEKVNLFYLMANSSARGKFEYYVIWTVGLVSIITAGGYENWKSWNLFQHSYYISAGDQELIQGNGENAKAMYLLARGNSQISPKANYNLASILIGNPYETADAVRYYQDATRHIEFPYARINSAAILALNNQAIDARNILRSARERNSYVENNLAILFQAEGRVDSAIAHFKKALLSNPGIAAIHSNLAMTYLDQDFLGEAQQFMQLANESSQESQASRTNQLFLQLQHPELDIKSNADTKSEDLFYSYNQILVELKNQPDTLNTKKIKGLLAESQMQSPELLLLDGIRLFYQDSIKYAITRVDFINSNYPNYAADANYLLAVGFYEKGVPEMALKYFHAAGKAGYSKARLHAAQMEIELGKADSANAHLSLLSVEADELYEEVAKERAMLLLPYVQNDVFASKMANLDNLSFNENILLGIYSDSLNQYITTLNTFRKAQQMDSASIAPYLELGRIYNKYTDTQAIVNLEAGLELSKKNDPALLLELAKAHLLQHNLERAEEIFQNIPDSSGIALEKLRFSGELALAKADTAQAIASFASLHGQQGLDQQAILRLASIFRNQKNYDAGNALITEALESNTENADLWYYYAVFSKAWNLDDDTGFGALKAIELTYSPKRKIEIAEEFSREIRILSSQ